jgi:hypothetical protein
MDCNERMTIAALYIPELTNDDLSTIGKIVEIVSPLLHHLPSLGKMRCPIVARIHDQRTDLSQG